jgi:GTP-binding protein
MIPVVALVGRPNVGKSTLFNRLTHTRDALVADFPGLTRDRKYGRAEWEGHEYIVIDTGGINGDEEGVETRMAGQSLVAIEEADIVLFMVDGRAGLMPADEGIAKHLRSRQKTTLLVANKTDGIDADSAVGDFYSLGLGEVYAIAATHGRGVNSLLEQALSPLVVEEKEDAGEQEYPGQEPWPEDDDTIPPDEEDTFDPQSLPIKLAIVGRPNVGKSTLINRILGEDRVVVYDMPGTTRDSIYIPMVRDEREFVLIDTAGVRKRGKITETVEKFSVIKTLRAIEDANVVLLVIDAREGISDQDLSLLGFILNSGRSLVIAVNKWDGLSQDVRDESDPGHAPGLYRLCPSAFYLRVAWQRRG